MRGILGLSLCRKGCNHWSKPLPPALIIGFSPPNHGSMGHSTITGWFLINIQLGAPTPPAFPLRWTDLSCSFIRSSIMLPPHATIQCEFHCFLHLPLFRLAVVFSKDRDNCRFLAGIGFQRYRVIESIRQAVGIRHHVPLSTNSQHVISRLWSIRWHFYGLG